ncbi:hypothetical protein T190_07460 [Sinorhizobium meliloti CCBAU 01290]|nr:hypothetical protein T190_07460 [Sinorhizobium meliloti CCBAU 01290]
MITVFGSISMDLAAIASKMPRPGERRPAAVLRIARRQWRQSGTGGSSRRRGRALGGAIGHDPVGADALAR